eukprot:jgi/Mesen1/2155/ME000152S01241
MRWDEYSGAKEEADAAGKVEESSDDPTTLERSPPWMLGDLSRALEGRRASDIRLMSIAVGLSSRGGLGKLEIKGCSSIRTARVTNLGLSSIGTRCAALSSLVLWECPYIDSEGLASIARGCRLLEKLDMLNCPRVTDKGLQAIAEGCPNLNQLVLDSCAMVGNLGLLRISQGCAKLATFSVNDCPMIGERGLCALVAGCKGLKKLTLGGSIALHDAGMKALSDSCTGEICQLKLHRLARVGEDGMRAIGEGRGFQKLRVLQVAGCDGLTGDALRSIARGCAELKSLCLRACDSVTDDSIAALFEGEASGGAPSCHLESLSLAHCQGISQRSLGHILGSSGNTALKVLSMEDCAHLQDCGWADPPPTPTVASAASASAPAPAPTLAAAIASLASAPAAAATATANPAPAFGSTAALAGPGLAAVTPQQQPLPAGCVALTTLHVRRCPGVGSAFLSKLLSACPCLEHVDLTGLPLLRDDALLLLAARCGGPSARLATLNLTGCAAVTDAAVCALAAGGCARSLRSLTLDGCRLVSDVGLAAVAAACTALQDLDVSKCAITDRGVEILVAARGAALSSLALASCVGLTDRCLKHIRLMCGGTLWGLNLKNCTGISKKAVSSLESSALLFRGPACLFVDS